jgi:hypothetical protein
MGFSGGKWMGVGLYLTVGAARHQTGFAKANCMGYISFRYFRFMRCDMRLSAQSKVRKSLQDMLDVELTTVLRSDSMPGASIPSLKSIHEMSKELAERMIGNPQFLDALGQIATKQEKVWLTTEEAAKLSGFSRPFIAALLDGPTYVGVVNRTEKGHRRIWASDFRKWLSKMGGTEQPLTVADVRRGFQSEFEPEGETAANKKNRLKSRDAALASARALGLA